MRDFLIKLLGGYRFVVVFHEHSINGGKTTSRVSTVYPLVKTIFQFKRWGGATYFQLNTDGSVRVDDIKEMK